MVGTLVAAIVLLALEVWGVRAWQRTWRPELMLLPDRRERTAAIAQARRRTVRVLTVTNIVLGYLLLVIAFSSAPVRLDHDGRAAHMLSTTDTTIVVFAVLAVILGSYVAIRNAFRETQEIAREVPRGSLRAPLGIRLITGGSLLVLLAVNETAVALLSPGAAYVVLLVAFTVLLVVLLGPATSLQIRFRGGVPMAEGDAATVRALADRLGVQLRGVYVYPQREARVAQAMQVGAFPGNRRVMFSDVLWQDLPPAERESVTGHELAHAARRHLAKGAGVQLLTVAAYLAFVVFVLPPRDAYVVPLLWYVFYLLVPRALSRRFESEADRIGAGLTSREDMAAALGAIAEINDTPRKHTGGALATHPGIERRQAVLLGATGTPQHVTGTPHRA